MSLGIFDFILLLGLLIGGIIGLKKGMIKEVISFVGLIIAIVIAWHLKNPISEFMYTRLPFFNFRDSTALINIILFEIVAFLIVLIILLIVLKFIVVMTGLVDKIVGIASGLDFVSKILGLIVGVLESYIVVFILMFCLYNFTPLKSNMQGTLTERALNNTPILSNLVKKEADSLSEIANIKFSITEESEKYNKELFEILVKHKVISTNAARKLIQNNKINIKDASEIIKKYE